MPMSSAQEPTRSSRTCWGNPTRLGFWFNSLVLGPLVLGVTATLGAAIGSLLGLLLQALFVGVGDHLMGSSWSIGGAGALAGALLASLTVLVWWISQTPRAVWTDDEKIVCWGLTGRTTIRWEDVVHAFVTTPTRAYEPDAHQTLHLTTRWRDLALSVSLITDTGHTTSQRVETFKTFVDTVQRHLEAKGGHLEREVPITSITNVAAPVRYMLYWPHRRLLARRFHALDTATAQPIDHHAPRGSMALGWLFRPAPIAATLVSAGLIVASLDSAASSMLTVGGVLMALFIPLWNSLKETLQRTRNKNGWMPETMIGQHTLSDALPSRLVPAPSCVIDFNTEQIHRPDGKVCRFDEIASVEYGPPKRVGQRQTILPTAWHLAVYREGEPRKPHEVYSNASVDIVRHGDLDPGYAAFNWITARELAVKTGANLILATGRVGRTRVGHPLAERLREDITRYDPAPLAEQMERSGERPRLAIHATDDRFDVWGPLIRQPEHCATPPLWKGALLAVAVGLMTVGFIPAGLLAGYLIASAIHDLITWSHFRAPGFTLDRDGVWVRGVCIPWDDLEESTLMPVAPGPILFAGSRTVLIAGHLGASYHERAWLGCAAYDWINQRICKTV